MPRQVAPFVREYEGMARASVSRPRRSPVLRWLARQVPSAIGARRVHRAGLAALEAGAWREADGLLDRAATGYRRDLEVEPLARCRVHQAMARALAACHGMTPDPHAHTLVLAADQALARLDTIELPYAPYTPVPARTLLGAWYAVPSSPLDSCGDDTLAIAA